ncbi:MAG: alpha-glucan family phosphorylase [Anaerolineae bacterium]|nr:alpha-glucan family phosphorylase [Anaerolineae bacterium]
MLRPYHTFTVIPSLPPQLRPLRELAYNLWWSWNLDVVDLFRRLDRDLWEETGHNPVLMLGKISQDRLEEAANDDGFLAHMMRVYQALNHYMRSTDTWFQKTYGNELPDLKIAYFSAEYGITECIPIYSGGLGVLAGDHLKSASSLGLPLVGVGLLYQEGYFRQYLNADGWQQESYPINDFHNMPLQLERDGTGQPVTIAVEYPGRTVKAQVWRVQVGRVPLYLLDANVPENSPEDRAITAQLYGGDLDMRIRQEILLGIGGMRALRALGIRPTICHMNEGHSAFLALERIRMAMEDYGLSFAEAKELTTAGNVFTTHTPVPAGIDLFPPSMMDHYFGEYYQKLGISREEFLALGRPPQHHPDESFSMAVLALHLSASANGVSRRHGEVARRMWQDLWPGLPLEEIPIIHITNGIHPRSWISHDMDTLLLRYLGPRWLERPEDQTVWERVKRIPDEELWNTHERRRERLVAVARERLAQQLARRGATPKEIAAATEVLNPDALTIGFARRFATYKRALLLFTDLDRLIRILNDPERPVQIIFAGKAHPRDNAGKEFIRQIVHLARREELRRRVIFLEDYDMSLARYLVQGADVWLNTPRPGLEASGTSGMKASANGVLHLSTFDGWWCEGYSPEVGWRIGSGEIYEDERYGDEVEARTLYDLLEKDVIPLFYERGTDRLPRQWIAKMKNAMSKVAPFFNTHRMVREYTEQLYIPAARRYNRLAANDYQATKALVAWLNKLHQHWGEVRILSVESDAHDEIPVSAEINIRARIQLGTLTPEDVTVQVFHGTVGPEGEIREYKVNDMVTEGAGEDGTYIYTGVILCEKSGLSGFTVRILPHHPDLHTPYIPGLIVWAS